MTEKIKRYIIFLIGLFINSFGVSFITKADLGTSPISSIPYVLSLNFPFTLGEFTIFFSLLLIFLQLIILRKNFKLEHFLQIPVSIIFGYFIDLTTFMLGAMNPELYPVKLISLLIGCVILGFGVYMEVLADVVMLPGESFVRAIVLTWKTNFGNTKVAFDASMTIIAGILSLFFFHRLQGVREGTIIAALLVGFIARLFGRLLAFLPAILYPELFEKKEAESLQEPENHWTIAIGRQYGCGGHEIGQKLAEKLGYKFYDGEIIEMIAGTTGYSRKFIKDREEKMTNSLLYDLVNQMYAYSPDTPAPKDEIFQAESQAIQKLAEEENCVIIGRCSDYVLKDHPHCLRVFLGSSFETRVKGLMESGNLSQKEAEQEIRLEDRRRRDNYRYYTRQPWGFSPNYHLTLDTGLGTDYCVDLILQTLSHLQK